jgi:ABC-type multidrug transport system fused ATPase/permease subunit
MENRLRAWLDLNPGRQRSEAPWYQIIRNSLMSVFKWHITLVCVLRFLSDLTALIYTYFIALLIEYVYDTEAPKSKGAWLLAIFISILCISRLFWDAFFMQGFYFAINMRKTIILALYDKLAKLSLKSLADTNSGKLITLISQDIFVIER